MIGNWRIFDIPQISDARGSLSFMEVGNGLPFEVKRVYYLYNVPENRTRGFHAHRALHQVMIAIAGGVEIHLDNGVDTETFTLDKPSKGLYLSPMTWRVLKLLSPNSVCLVLASEKFLESDYIREYGEFIEESRAKPS